MARSLTCKLSWARWVRVQILDARPSAHVLEVLFGRWLPFIRIAMLEVRSISFWFALALVYPSCWADPLTCYYPDGSIAESHVPCNADAVSGTDNASACCLGYGDAYCTVNGLCNYRGGLIRASCTDSTWKSLKCPRQCTNGRTFQIY